MYEPTTRPHSCLCLLYCIKCEYIIILIQILLMFDLIFVAISQLTFHLVLSILLQYKLSHLVFVRSVMFRSGIRFRVRKQVRNFQAALAGFQNATSCSKLKTRQFQTHSNLAHLNRNSLYDLLLTLKFGMNKYWCPTCTYVWP